MWCFTRLCSWSFVSPNFADDTNLLYANKNLKSLEKTVNNELVRVSGWLNANKLTLKA